MFPARKAVELRHFAALEDFFLLVRKGCQMVSLECADIFVLGLVCHGLYRALTVNLSFRSDQEGLRG